MPRHTLPLLLLLHIFPLQLAAQAEFDATFVRYAGLRYACDGVFTPVVTIKNLGSTAMNSCVVDTWKNGVQVNTFNWILAVAALPNESRKPALPVVADVEPGDVVEFRIISVNGQPDQDASGNIITVDVEDAPPTAMSYVVRVALPASGLLGTTWRVINALAQPVAQGGPYSGANNEEAWVTLEADQCYALELSGDAACEGRIYSEGQEVLAVSCQGEAGTYSQGFLTGTILGVEDMGLSSRLTLSPNPTVGPVGVTLPSELGPYARITLWDATGRELQAPVVAANVSTQLFLDLSGYPDGAYLVHVQMASGAIQQGRVMLVR